VKVSHSDRHKKQFRKDIYGVRLKKVLAISVLGKLDSPKVSDLHAGKNSLCS